MARIPDVGDAARSERVGVVLGEAPGEEAQDLPRFSPKAGIGAEPTPEPTSTRQAQIAINRIPAGSPPRGLVPSSARGTNPANQASATTTTLLNAQDGSSRELWRQADRGPSRNAGLIARGNPTFRALRTIMTGAPAAFGTLIRSVVVPSVEPLSTTIRYQTGRV